MELKGDKKKMTRIEEIIGMKNPCKNCPKDIEDCAKTHTLCEKGDEFWRKASKIQLDSEINHARTAYVAYGLGALYAGNKCKNEDCYGSDCPYYIVSGKCKKIKKIKNEEDQNEANNRYS